MLANKSPLSWSCKSRLKESPHINRLELVAFKKKEMEDRFRKQLQRCFLNGGNIHLFLKLVASPADCTLDKGGDESWPHHQVVDQPIASKSRTAEKYPCTPLGKDLQQLPQRLGTRGPEDIM